MRKGKNGIRRIAALVCSVALFATLLPVQVLATDEGMQEPLTAVTLLDENGEETVSEQGDADNQQEEAVACTKDENCAAETHEEDCPKYEAPAEDEVTDPAVSCTKGEDCAAETHEEDCPKYEAPDEDEGTDPAVSCTKDENCAAETHEEDCLGNQEENVQNGSQNVEKERSVTKTPGTPDTAWWDNRAENQTEFHLSTADQLAGLILLSNQEKKSTADAAFAGCTVYLDNDIDMSGYSGSLAGNEEKGYTFQTTENYNKLLGGSIYYSNFVLDGQNHAISNFVFSSNGNYNNRTAFIAGTSAAGTVRNLVFKDCAAVSDKNVSLHAIVVGQNRGSVENVQLENCIVYTPSGTYVGGIVGRNSGTVKGCTVSDCYIVGGTVIGGISGYEMADGSSPSVVNQNNNVVGTTIKASGQKGNAGSVGGITGEINCGSTEYSMRLDTCHVQDVHISVTAYGAALLVGALNTKGAGNEVQLTDCTAYGSVYGTYSIDETIAMVKQDSGFTGAYTMTGCKSVRLYESEESCTVIDDGYCITPADGYVLPWTVDSSDASGFVYNKNSDGTVTLTADPSSTDGNASIYLKTIPLQQEKLFGGYYKNEFYNGDPVDKGDIFNVTYYPKWIDFAVAGISQSVICDEEKTIEAPAGVIFTGYSVTDETVADCSIEGEGASVIIRGKGAGEAKILIYGTYQNGSSSVSVQTAAEIPVTVTPRVLTYKDKSDQQNPGSITYNYKEGHTAISDVLTLVWNTDTGEEVTLIEGIDIDYTYAVSSENGGDGIARTYNYLPMPVGTYDVSFNLKNPNYTFALSDGATGNTLKVQVNVTAEGTQRAYLASAAPKADQNFVYNGQGVLPVEGTLNAYAENDSSTSPVDIGKFTVNIEGLNGTSYRSEMSDIAAGTDLSGISGLKLPTEPGTYIITASAVNEDYYLYKSLVFTIKKATVTITAADKTVITGDSDGLPPLTSEDYTVTGLVGNDKLTTPPTLDYEYGANVDTVGTYDIIPSGAAANADRYTIQYVKGTLHVEKIAIIEGANQTWTQGSGSDLVIRSNADFSDFLRVEVNGNALVRDQNYTVRSGSTIVTIKAAYLDTLAAGDYTFAIVSKTGTASTHFTVKAKAAGESGASGNTGAATATPAPSGSSITYYTCPACGYHDWTAGADGYQCNHCGYVESVKQLSGYGNVTGVYEPNGGNVPQTAPVAAIPQTGDNSQPLVWVALVGISGAALAALAVFRRKRSDK